MRSRTTPDDHLAEVTLRRLEQLSAEIAGTRSDLQLPRTDEQVDEAGGLARRVTAPPASGRHARRSVGWRGLVAGWLHDRLPPTLQGRVRLGATHLGVLAVTIASGLAVTAWWVLHTDDAGELVPAASPVTATPLVETAPTDSVTVGEEGSQPAGVVVVDVAGKVHRPGIATLPAGSRVVDALRAAGGVRPGVDRTSINLARVLVDGEQIVVGEPAVAGPAAAAAGGPTGQAASLVNLNTADQATLESLPGVGPVTAQAIMAWREENGGFTSVDDLLEVSGIGDATLAELAPFVTL
jgi:competence protein ComEA